jgi:hypothetical protein
MTRGRTTETEASSSVSDHVDCPPPQMFAIKHIATRPATQMSLRRLQSTMVSSSNAAREAEVLVFKHPQVASFHSKEAERIRLNLDAPRNLNAPHNLNAGNAPRPN